MILYKIDFFFQIIKAKLKCCIRETYGGTKVTCVYFINYLGILCGGHRRNTSNEAELNTPFFLTVTPQHRPKVFVNFT
jgi:hypothetical protein